MAAGILFLFILVIVKIHPVRSMIMDTEGETAAAQPAQPASGPGGSDYKHADITAFHYGEGNGEFWIFEPADPKPDSAPVVVFLHGWMAMYPKMYGAWIRHIVLRGNIVIYPRYQENIRVSPDEMVANAVAAVKEALGKLKEPDHVAPEFDKFAAVGHSLGGVLTGNLAAISGRVGIPSVRAAMPVEPGDTTTSKTPQRFKQKFPTIMADYSTIPSETLLICIAGEDDDMVGDTAATKICNGATAVPPENKNFIVFRTDRHGTPILAADHMMPLAPDDSVDFAPPEEDGPVRSLIKKRLEQRSEKRAADEMYAPNAYDYNGTWRLFDALTDCAFYKKNCDYALGDSEKVRFMGKWSDGTPVEELEVTSTPGGK